MALMLTSLDAKITQACEGGFQTLTFLCPKCRKTEIKIGVWGDGAQQVQVGVLESGQPDVRNIWKLTGGDLHNATITPSIDRQPCSPKCEGWHGFVTDGQVTGA